MESIWRDVRYALRRLRSSPGFAATAISILALGIALNTAVFSIGYSVLWRPLDVPEPDRVAVLYAATPDIGYSRFSYPDYVDFREGTDAFEDLAASEIIGVTLIRRGESRALFGQAVTSNYFAAFGVNAEQGRTFGDEVEADGETAAVAVLSRRAWRRYFAADPGVVGRQVTLNGHAVTVIGIMPERFRGAYNYWFAPEIWLPMRALATLEPERVAQKEERTRANFHLVGRLRRDVSPTQAEAQVEAVLQRIQAESPNLGARRASVMREIDTRPEADVASIARRAFGVFQALAALVLLVACANISNLLLARAAARRREMAIRTAVGAGQARLVRQLLTEGLLLAGAGAAVGAFLAHLIVAALGQIEAPTFFPLEFDFVVDRWALGFALATGGVTALGFGLVPAISAARSNLVLALKGDEGRGAARRPRLMTGLVVTQVAVSVIALVMAGLFLRSMAQAEQEPLGFSREPALLVTLGLDVPGYEAPERHALLARLQERLEGLEGVRHASFGYPLPMEFNADGGRVFTEEEAASADESAGRVSLWSEIGPGYFETMGTRIIDGRGFDAGDGRGDEKVMVINALLAETLWPGQNALGRSLRLRSPDGEAYRVVGVVETGKYRSIFEDPVAYVYLPAYQHDAELTTLVLRTGSDPAKLAPAVRAQLQELDDRLPVLETKTLDDLLAGRALLAFRSGASLGGVLGIGSLALAIVGLYGVVTLGVQQRRREIGLRIALGAARGTVTGMVLRQGMAPVALGLLIGTGGALLLNRVASGLLVGAESGDPLTFGSVVATMTLLGAASTYLPARQAARVDPAVALRSE